MIPRWHIVTDSVVALMDSYLPVEVGDGAAPDGVPAPFLVVYTLGAGADTPPGWSQPGGSQWGTYQLTGVGASRKAAEALTGDALALVLTRLDDGRGFWRALNPTSHRVVDRQLAPGTGVSREGNVWNAHARFRLLAHRTA